MKRLDEQRPGVLVQIREPVNKFPDFVRNAVRRLKILCPSLGKVKMAEILCRVGLQLSNTTVGRILKESPHPKLPEVRKSSHSTRLGVGLKRLPSTDRPFLNYGT